jgi:tRNA A58 N-methylase Trm61
VRDVKVLDETDVDIVILDLPSPWEVFLCSQIVRAEEE